MIELKPFHIMLKRIREERGVTRKQAADYFGVCPLTISNWERGSNPQMGREYVISQVRLMGTSGLMGGRGERIIELELGIPPSVNSYYGYGRGRVYIKAAGKKYRSDVTLIVRHAGIEPLEGDLVMEIDFYPPDRRKRDWDNILKCACDSLEARPEEQYAGAYHDDSQIYKGTVEKFAPIKGGKILVRLWERD